MRGHSEERSDEESLFSCEQSDREGSLVRRLGLGMTAYAFFSQPVSAGGLEVEECEMSR